MNSANLSQPIRSFIRSDANRLGPVLFDRFRIRDAVYRMGREIHSDYAGKDLLLVGILKGGATFTVDLSRAIELPLTMDWVAISTPGRIDRGSVTDPLEPMRPTLVKGLSEPVRGRHVLVAADVLGSGLTLSRVVDLVWALRPASVQCAVLLTKKQPTAEPIQPKYVGLRTDASWVAGYGADHGENYRQLRDIHEVRLARRAQLMHGAIDASYPDELGHPTWPNDPQPDGN
ncbi:MAG: hypoxanthine phosphoribosyltransferase [Frankiales bacterium]|nr:hypoxanthine phosphoribosyltransferase [Frankiales bacterium]